MKKGERVAPNPKPKPKSTSQKSGRSCSNSLMVSPNTITFEEMIEKPERKSIMVRLKVEMLRLHRKRVIAMTEHRINIILWVGTLRIMCLMLILPNT